MTDEPLERGRLLRQGLKRNPRDQSQHSITQRRVLSLALPNVLANLTQPLVGIVGTMVAGHLPGPAPLAGVALGTAFLNLIFWNFLFLKKTTAGLAAQAYGSKDRTEQSDTLWRAILTAIAIGILLLAATPLLTGLGLPMLGGAADVQAVAQLYVGIRLSGAILIFGNAAALGYLLGIQRSGLALIAQVCANVVHVALAVVFVFVLEWGVAGLAIAALIGDATGFAVGLLLSAADGLRRPSRTTLSPAALWRLVSVNGDMFARSLSMTFALAWFTRAGAREGTIILAANAVLLNFQSMLGLVIEGFATAGQSLVGAAYGARNKAMAEAVIRITGLWASLLAAIFMIGYAGWGANVIGALTNQSDIVAAAAVYLPWMIVAPGFMAWAFLLDGLFMGATRTRDLRNSMIVAVGCFIPAATAGQAAFGNHGLWAAYVLMMGLRAASLGWALRRNPLVDLSR